jgi:hypothetical protein
LSVGVVLGKGEDEWTPSAGTIVLTVEEGRDGGEARGEFFSRDLVKISEDTFKPTHPKFLHTVRLWCAFTTASMALAYASTRHPKPKVSLAF